MAVICGPITETISYGNKLICNRLVKISNIHQYYETIEVMIDNQQIISGIGNVSVYLIPDFTKKAVIKLIGKNVSAGTATISFAIETVEAPPPVEEATHYLDIYVKPYSWYSPSGAAGKIVSKLGDITGTVTNLFADITDYKYLGTEILTLDDNVVIRLHVKQLSVAGMAAPLLAAVAGIVLKLLVIIFFVGVITGWKFKLSGAIAELTDKKYSDDDVAHMFEDDIVPEQRKICKEKFANDPVGLANCEKAVQSGGANGLSDALGIPGIDATTLGIDSKIDKCLAEYNIHRDMNRYYGCLNGVAADVRGDTLAEVPKEPTDILTWLLIGGFVLGGLYIVTKGAEKVAVPVLVERERLKAGG
jgi:hypothetical protein